MAFHKNERVSRRKFLKRMGTGLAGVLLFSASLHGYGKYVEPNWLEVQRFDFIHPNIPKEFEGFTILQFSDTHLGFHFSLEKFENILGTIRRENPDMVVFTGDLVDNLLSFISTTETIALLDSIHAPYGKYACFGNHDHGGWGTEKYRDMMRMGGFRLLQNEWVFIRKGNSQIIVAGIDDALLGKPDFPGTLGSLDGNDFTLLLSHAPDLADQARNFPVHLQLSGHTHGGQVKLPLIGPVILPRMGKKYSEGFYTLSDNFSLYVNRGLGMTELPYRFLSRPEITLFTLRTKDRKGDSYGINE